MAQLLGFLTQYSNLILVTITGIYAYLTWRMVREMKVAREVQADAHLIATPVPMGPVSVQVKLENVGPGPALAVESSISLEPPLETVTKTWRHPSFPAGQTEFFLLPLKNKGGTIPSLNELAEQHENLIVALKWKNIFGIKKSSSESFNLKRLADGWYNAGHLIQPESTDTQLKKFADTFDKIHRTLESIHREIKK